VRNGAMLVRKASIPLKNNILCGQIDHPVGFLRYISVWSFYY
jgi:hypothetical protein